MSGSPYLKALASPGALQFLAAGFPGRLRISMFGLGTVLPSGPPEIEATLAAHDEWVAAGCPGARSHEDVMAELLGSGQ